ncbi:MAG: hypothetical protein ACHQNV_03430 [Vicinamibacteria bacterium]
MSEVGPELAAWVKGHAPSFEVAPLVEFLKGRQVQVGFTLSLYARLPMEKAPREERRAAAEEIRKHLREIVQALAPPQDSRARVEIEAPRATVVIEPGGGREPEVAVHARVFHRDDYFAETTVAEEKRVHDATRRLTDMGVRERPRRVS